MRAPKYKARLAYLKYVLRHKWYAFLECCKYRLYWRGVTHDLSKFYPSEWGAYTRSFYNEDGSKKHLAKGEKPALEFALAWLHHQKRNNHHWEYWVLVRPGSDDKLMPMSDRARKEMVADWRAASRAITGSDNTRHWFMSHKDTIELHTETREWVEQELYG